MELFTGLMVDCTTFCSINPVFLNSHYMKIAEALDQISTINSKSAAEISEELHTKKDKPDKDYFLVLKNRRGIDSSECVQVTFNSFF